MLWFQSSPQELVLADRETEKKGIIFSQHQATLMPLDRKEQETCLCVEKEGREEMETCQEPLTTSGPAPIPLQLSLWEGPASALPTTAVAVSNGAEN